MSEREIKVRWDLVRDDVQKVENCYYEQEKHQVDCTMCDLNLPTTDLDDKCNIIKGEDTRCNTVFKLFNSWWR